MRHVVNASTGQSSVEPNTAAQDASAAAETEAWAIRIAAQIAAADLRDKKLAAIEAILEDMVDDARFSSIPEVVTYRSRRP